MLKVQEIREIIKLIDQSSIDEFVYESEGSKIKMKKHAQDKGVVVSQQPLQVVQAVPAAQPAPVAQPAPASLAPVQQPEAAAAGNDQEELHKIVSPMVGTFYQSPSPEADPYVKPGSKISSDSVVCIVEAMKLFNEIEAEVNGEIVEVLVKDGQLVEYGQPLFLVKATGER
ncbi:acetyl-CoA carboxylase biotin carboxyl carrier protein [Neobacillus notoginsengisoli]|uniref:Biotin carboxyl carrier protein of acetyl-CoA carboxylase n=1 Tax=Neobacillus notoginsengisoli TaxID=1578198 RepID=A0A417YUY8_9BACI|nr:acetyl-CoA carboxylase biotin carboxyl carrier protein [Neobacillus notoginsengisoli]RHW41116.1 acetyl-CoA carboxylase biotin carboxyl carrier protein [Neobacillus notoginsengisoli]